MIDPRSATWAAIEAHCREAIEAGRSALERQADAEQTTFQRGRIAALREVLALSAPPSETEIAPGKPFYG